jgi:hypothetical protein
MAISPVKTDVLPPFFKVEWTVAQPIGAEEQLFQKYKHIIFKISAQYCRQRTYAARYPKPKGLEFKLTLILPINIKLRQICRHPLLGLQGSR